jgi:TP53 regulating kinase-like protein
METGLCRNPMDVDSLIKSLGAPQWRGAEAYLYIISWLGRPAILKVRLPKTYRHPLLDIELRWSRTATEARGLLAAMKAGVNVPKLYYVDPPCTLIVTEYIRGELLVNIVKEDPKNAYEQDMVLGEMAGKLHEAGIAHGDLTTSNAIVDDKGRLYLIDFGLSTLKASLRDQAVDVHLYLRSLESTTPAHVNKMMDSFMEGYSSVRGRDKAAKILELVKEIRMMGRYVAERRTAWAGEQ